MDFLGLTDYCGLWVPHSVDLTKISVSEVLPWRTSIHTFIRLKQTLQEPPALGLPTSQTFHFIGARKGSSSPAIMLPQEHGDKQRPIA